MHSEEKYQENEKAAYWKGEDSCRWFVGWGVNIQKKQRKEKNGLKNKQRTWIDFFFQRRHTNSHQIHEKAVSITNHWGNANQNHDELSPSTCQKTTGS